MYATILFFLSETDAISYNCVKDSEMVINGFFSSSVTMAAGSFEYNEYKILNVNFNSQSYHSKKRLYKYIL